jgi:DNA-binding XRE family transcriptional regulator
MSGRTREEHRIFGVTLAHIGQNLIRYREYWGLSQLDMAALLDVELDYIYEIETGRRGLSLWRIQKFATSMRCPMTQILAGL